MIKGHTKIELTNVKTGEKRVVEDDNLVTNAINKYFEMGAHMTAFPKIFTNPYIDTFFGGLLLFQNPIEEKADNYILPAGNRMIGNAIAKFSSTNSPEFGSYNSEESAFSVENGVATRKYVYDFGTDKANGNISTVCLTNPYMGYFGAGNQSGKRETEVTNELINLPFRPTSDDGVYNAFLTEGIGSFSTRNFANDVSFPTGENETWLGFDFLNNCAYKAITNNIFYSSSYSSKHFTKTGYLDLYKGHFPFNKLNPMPCLFNGITFYEKMQISVPSEIQNLTNPYIAISINSKSVAFIIIDQNLYQNKTFYVWKLSNGFQTSELFTLSNTTGKNISFQYNSINWYIHVIGDFVLIMEGGSTTAFKFDLKNPTKATEISLPSYPYSGANQHVYGKNSVVIIGGTGAVYKIDLIENRADILNGRAIFSSDNDHNRYTVCSTLNSEDYFIKYEAQNLSGNSYIRVIRNPFTLSTINNLSEPVTKTSDMTMKITYTLTSKIEPDEV